MRQPARQPVLPVAVPACSGVAAARDGAGTACRSAMVVRRRPGASVLALLLGLLGGGVEFVALCRARALRGWQGRRAVGGA